MSDAPIEKPFVRCFISMPFSAEFDEIFLQGISSVPELLPQYDLDLIRLDKEAYSRRHIEENVLNRIDAANVLLADITPHKDSAQPNVSVMHEIGYACGKKIPFILIGQSGTHRALPANLKGSLVVEYQSNDRDFKNFARKVAQQLSKTIEEEVLDQIRGEFRVECFTARHKINLPYLIAKASQKICILTTNLDYTLRHLRTPITQALENNKQNSAFKIEILTMDPESDVANARAVQLGRTVREYRNELRKSLDDMREAFGLSSGVEIVTYRSLPTLMIYVVDDVVIVATVSLGQQSREGVHFVIKNFPTVAEPFLAHFRVLKTLAVANA